MLQALSAHFLPNKVVLLRPTEQESPEIVRLAAYTEPYMSIDDKATAYVTHKQNLKPACQSDTHNIQ